MEGYCCADALCQAALEGMGKEDALLTRALKGLCNGMYSGGVCGALTGGACMISLLAAPIARGPLVRMLSDWFMQVYGESCGGICCRDIRVKSDCSDVPLRYNNDKPEKPVVSRV